MDYPNFPVAAYLEVDGGRFVSVENALEDPELARQALEHLGGRELDHRERKWLTLNLRNAAV
jgi:hypothetical protein